MRTTVTPELKIAEVRQQYLASPACWIRLNGAQRAIEELKAAVFAKPDLMHHDPLIYDALIQAVHWSAGG